MAEDDIPFRDVASLIGRRLNVPVINKSPADAPKQFGFLAPSIPMDKPSLQQTDPGEPQLGAPTDGLTCGSRSCISLQISAGSM